MFRVGGKPGKAVDKEAEKKKARKQVYQSVVTFGGIVFLLRIGTCVRTRRNGRRNQIIRRRGGGIEQNGSTHAPRGVVMQLDYSQSS